MLFYEYDFSPSEDRLSYHKYSKIIFTSFQYIQPIKRMILFNFNTNETNVILYNWPVLYAGGLLNKT